jgi:hypothetical protein
VCPFTGHTLLFLRVKSVTGPLFNHLPPVIEIFSGHAADFTPNRPALSKRNCKHMHNRSAFSNNKEDEKGEFLYEAFSKVVWRY